MRPKRACCVLLIAAAALMTGRAPCLAKGPNVVLLLADDLSWFDLPIFGGQAKMPNLRQMASDGMVFSSAIGSSAMCTPTRHSLYTGLYPTSHGGYQNHSRVRRGTQSMVQRLGRLGYRVGLTGKRHVGPKPSFPFERVPGFPVSCVLAKTPPHRMAGARAFMTRDHDEPFCLVVASVHPHAPWSEGPRDAYDARTVKLPPHWVDTPKSRRAYVRYLAEATALDNQIGDIRATLRDTGLEEQTLFLFASEQGHQFPGAKLTLWDAGTRFGLVACWPGTVAAGARTAALVQYEDVLPTLIDLAGGQPAKTLDGQSFKQVLMGRADRHREYAYSFHANVPEGPAYPVRSVRDSRFKLIWNLTPDKPFEVKYITQGRKGGLWTEWVAKAARNPRAAAAVRRYQQRPEFELYDLQADPYELDNLAGSAEHADAQKRLKQELDRWMTRQRDTGAAMDQPRRPA